MEYPEYKSCHLCPRACGVDRSAGHRGFCGETSQLRVAALEAHFGEEPCFVGESGSGTVFFSGCSCGCFFCQNHQISQRHLGEVLTEDELFERLLELARSGVGNLNFVTPDHFLPHLLPLGKRLRQAGIDLPFLWNSSGYMMPDSAALLDECFDIFLPDFKFADAALARKCMGDERYPELALETIRRLFELAGPLRPWDDEGTRMAEQGVMVRHLVLPGEVENSRMVLRALAENCGTDLPLSIMSQFQPTSLCQQRGSFTRTVSSAEYEAVCDCVMELGFEQVFIQPDFGDTDFLPDFEGEHPFAGNRR